MKVRRCRSAELLARAVVMMLFLFHGSPCRLLLVSGTGKGPIALWESTSDNRTVIVADSSLPGLVVVDLQWGQALERLDLSFWEANPISVASCDDCPFLFLTATSGRYFIIHLMDTVAKLLSSSRQDDGVRRGLRLYKAFVEEIGHQDEVVRDGRTCTLAPQGSSIYLSSYADHSVYKISAASSNRNGDDDDNDDEPANVLEDPNYALEAKPLLYHVAPHHPYGIDFDTTGHNLLVTMHKQDVWRIDADTGEVRRKYNAVRAGCPGALEHDPNQRQAVDDHTVANMDSILILATSPVSYDAVIWRLMAIPKNQHDNDRRQFLRRHQRRQMSRTRHSKESTATHVGHGKKTCEVAFGGIGRGSDWVDGVGESILFTRPHHMVLSRHLPETLLVTDVDNRALRLIHLSDGSSHSIMYDRDRVLNEARVFHQERVDKLNAQLQHHKQHNGGRSSRSHDKAVKQWQREKAHKEQLLRTTQHKPHIYASQKSCADFHQHHANAFVDYDMTLSPLNTPVKVLTQQQLHHGLMTAPEAEEYCASIGARLCEPTELKRRYDGDHDGGWGRRSRDATITWTAASCASCWLRHPGALPQCPANHRTSDGTLLTKKTANQTHTAEGFQQSWNSGRALEVGAAATLQLSPDNVILSRPPAASSLLFYGSKTICPGRNGQSYRATVTCCVDCFAPGATSSSEEDPLVTGGE